MKNKMKDRLKIKEGGANYFFMTLLKKKKRFNFFLECDINISLKKTKEEYKWLKKVT